MFQTILQMFIIIAAGVGIRVLGIGHLPADQLRRGITDLVFHVLLPALVLQALWQAELGWVSLKIAALAAAGVLISLALSRQFCRLCGMPPARTAALMLAAGFPNVTYLGLPVLEKTFGTQARSVAIQYDLFACTPLLLTLGIFLAQRYGVPVAGGGNALQRLLRVPPLWAALAGALLSALAVPLPGFVNTLLSNMAAAVVPLMLLALGMGLYWPARGGGNLLGLANPVLIQLLIMPLLVWGGALAAGMDGWVRTAMVLEAAMPSMVIGIMICDRYGLDSTLYAQAVTLTTLLSLGTLPMWYHLAGAL